MTFQTIQKEVDTWIQDIWVTYFDEMTNLAQLTEEVWEIARVMVREYGEQSWKKWKKPEDPTQELGDEIADVLFVLTCIANQTWVDLQAVRDRWMDKRCNRDKERHWDNEKLTSKLET